MPFVAPQKEVLEAPPNTTVGRMKRNTSSTVQSGAAPESGASAFASDITTAHNPHEQTQIGLGRGLQGKPQEADVAQNTRGTKNTGIGHLTVRL